MQHATVCLFEDFLGTQVIPATASNLGGPWAKADTSSAGSPTVQGVASENGGAVKLLCDSQSEAQILTLYWGDILGILATKIQRIAYRLKASAIAANEILAFGVCNARNDTLDSVGHNCWCRLDATADILVETDDAATDDDDNDTGLDITAGVYKEYVIDFSNGLSDIRFFVSDGNGNLQRVLAKTTFAMPGSAAIYLQPLVQLQKASGTTTPYATVDWICVEYKR
jgi:hypothetical protein